MLKKFLENSVYTLYKHYEPKKMGGVMEVKKLQKWGNGTGVLLSKEAIAKLKLSPGSRVEIEYDEHQIIIRRPKKPSLDELLDSVKPEDDSFSEIGSGVPQGEEVVE